ncbi:MAG: hypothetical protein NC184_03070 [Roseburia sp.]|nr:hypothetical protein [Roseburia sp.]
MFELEYKITESDIKSVNKGIMLKYFFPYLAVSLLGLAAGLTAVILRPRVDLLVLGIILIVLGAMLLVCALLLAIAPKNFFASAVFASDETVRKVAIDGDGITVKTDGASDIVFRKGEINRVAKCRTGLLAYVGKDTALIIKDAFTDGHNLTELGEFLKRGAAPAPENNGEQMPENDGENAPQVTTDAAVSDADVEANGDGENA